MCNGWTLLTVTLLLAGCAQTSDVASKQEQVRIADGVFYLDARTVAPANIPNLWAAPWRELSRSSDGRASLAVRLDAGDGPAKPGSYSSDVELFVLAGSVRIGSAKLGRRDYAHIPAGAVVPGPSALEASELLVFSTGALEWTATESWADSDAIQVVRYNIAPWKGGEVSRAAGEDIPLRIKHYRNDPITGARTFLVSSGPEAIVPWERHSVVEEGYLIEGDYTLAECLPDGKVVGRYEVGGYFYRPPGIVHSGPESKTRGGATWLIRTPATMDVEFFDQGCPPQRA